MWIIIGVACGVPALLFIMGIVASIAIPFMLGSRQGAAQEEARNALRTVASAEFAYYATNGEYAATLADLVAPTQYLDPAMASGSLPNGITLTLSGLGQSFTATATCANPPCTLTVDETGQIR